LHYQTHMKHATFLCVNCKCNVLSFVNLKNNNRYYFDYLYYVNALMLVLNLILTISNWRRKMKISTTNNNRLLTITWNVMYFIFYFQRYAAPLISFLWMPWTSLTIINYRDLQDDHQHREHQGYGLWHQHKVPWRTLQCRRVQ